MPPSSELLQITQERGRVDSLAGVSVPAFCGALGHVRLSRLESSVLQQHRLCHPLESGLRFHRRELLWFSRPRLRLHRWACSPCAILHSPGIFPADVLMRIEGRCSSPFASTQEDRDLPASITFLASFTSTSRQQFRSGIYSHVNRKVSTTWRGAGSAPLG
jgi:hypothetical protein